MSSLPSPNSQERISRLGRRLALKPYGDELLTRSGDFWIFSARLIILTMALAEGLAWGYMGSLMSRAHPLAAAVIAGTAVFTLIWIIDATFMSLDLSRAFYERALTGRKQNALKEKLKLTGGVAARVAIVTASLFITAPFLAQAIFAGDVSDEMTRRNAGVVAAKRAEIDQPLAQRLAVLREEQRTLEQQRVQEAAGRGPSGRYGRGPALETIERQLTAKLTEIRDAEAARASVLGRFDSLSRPQLEAQHGVRFLSPGVQSSSELLDEMMKNPQFTGAELAVRAFLGFLFLGLLILKGFQPRSIAVYYNEQLHSIYDEYRKGLFDNYLPDAERAKNGGDIDPLRFEDWCVNTYALIRREDERRRDTAREYRIHELLIEQWKQLESASVGELEPPTRRYEETLAAIDVLETEFHSVRTSAEAARDDLARVSASLATMHQHLESGDLEGDSFQQAVAATRELDERRKTLSVEVRNGEAAVERMAKRLELRRSHASALEAEITNRQRVIEDARRRISAERMTLAENVANQRTMWSSGTA